MAHPTTIISWLGFAGPLGQGLLERGGGARVVDFLLVDRHALPPDSAGGRRNYRDRLLYLPSTYQPQDDRGDDLLFPATANGDAADLPAENVSASAVARGRALYNLLRSSVVPDAGRRELLRHYLLRRYLPEDSRARAAVAGGTWLACLNRMEKVTPDAFEDWVQILRRSAGAGAASYLVLQTDEAGARESLSAYAMHYGVPSWRLLFVPRMSKRDYSLLLGLSDLFLDTRHYNAHTIASDALFRETPVLTLAGNSFASRVGASLNNAVDHLFCPSTGEQLAFGPGLATCKGLGVGSLLTTNSRKEYVDTAIRLVARARSGASALMAARPHMRGPRASNSTDTHSATASVLFNPSSHSRQLEHLFQAASEPALSGRGHVFFERSI